MPHPKIPRPKPTKNVKSDSKTRLFRGLIREEVIKKIATKGRISDINHILRLLTTLNECENSRFEMPASGIAKRSGIAISKLHEYLVFLEKDCNLFHKGFAAYVEKFGIGGDKSYSHFLESAGIKPAEIQKPKALKPLPSHPDEIPPHITGTRRLILQRLIADKYINMGITEIATDVGIHLAGAYKHISALKKHYTGVESKFQSSLKKRAKKILPTEAQQSQIKEMIMQGKTTEEIRRALSLSKYIVSRFINEIIEEEPILIRYTPSQRGEILRGFISGDKPFRSMSPNQIAKKLNLSLWRTEKHIAALRKHFPEVTVSPIQEREKPRPRTRKQESTKAEATKPPRAVERREGKHIMRVDADKNYRDEDVIATIGKSKFDRGLSLLRRNKWSESEIWQKGKITGIAFKSLLRFIAPRPATKKTVRRAHTPPERIPRRVEIPKKRLPIKINPKSTYSTSADISEIFTRRGIDPELFDRGVARLMNAGWEDADIYTENRRVKGAALKEILAFWIR